LNRVELSIFVPALNQFNNLSIKFQGRTYHVRKTEDQRHPPLSPFPHASILHSNPPTTNLAPHTTSLVHRRPSSNLPPRRLPRQCHRRLYQVSYPSSNGRINSRFRILDVLQNIARYDDTTIERANDSQAALLLANRAVLQGTPFR
jgi:hypothetical protein